MGSGVREWSGEATVDAENGEELMRVVPGVDIALGNLPRESNGTLYITTKQVIWLRNDDAEINTTKRGYAVDFLSISLHAVSRDSLAYPVPCLYTQIETGSDDDDDAGSDNSDSEGNHVIDVSKIREMRLIPSDPTQLDTLFEVFCECAELNPEPNDDTEEGEEHQWIFSADQMEDEGGEADEEDYISQNPSNTLGHSNGHHDLARNVLQLQLNDPRFEDAEEIEHNGDVTHR